MLKCLIVQALSQCVLFSFTEFFWSDMKIDSKSAENIQFEILKILSCLCVDHNVIARIEKHGKNIQLQALAKQGIFSTFVNYLALRVHHVIIFQQSLTNAEVVFLYFLLSSLDRICHHRMLDYLALFQSKPIHDASNALRHEQPHQIVFQNHIKT